MHEIGLCADIVAAIERRAGERPVARATVRVGRLHHVHPEAFEQSFALAASGGVAEGAHAELVLVPATAYCRSCDRSIESDELISACPQCGDLSVEQTGGDELVLQSIEYRPTAG